MGIFGLGTHKVQNFGFFGALPLGEDWVTPELYYEKRAPIKNISKGPSIIYVSTLGYLVGQQNTNLVNRPYLVKMLTRVLTWSKMGKNGLT